MYLIHRISIHHAEIWNIFRYFSWFKTSIQLWIPSFSNKVCVYHLLIGAILFNKMLHLLCLPTCWIDKNRKRNADTKFLEQECSHTFCKVGSRHPVTSCGEEAVIHIWNLGLLGTDKNSWVRFASELLSCCNLVPIDLDHSVNLLCLYLQNVLEMFWVISFTISIHHSPSLAEWGWYKECQYYWGCLCSSISKNTSKCKGTFSLILALLCANLIAVIFSTILEII